MVLAPSAINNLVSSYWGSFKIARLGAKYLEAKVRNVPVCEPVLVLKANDKHDRLGSTSHYVHIRSDEGLTLETSALYSLRWPIYIFNLVDTTKLPCYPHRRSTTVSLETFTLYTFNKLRARSILKSRA